MIKIKKWECVDYLKENLQLGAVDIEGIALTVLVVLIIAIAVMSLFL
jgi:hypothetical protein